MARSRIAFLLKKNLKKAKLYQIQKITKNIRTLNGRKGDESQLEKFKRKSERFSKELEIIKDIKLTELSNLILAKDDSISNIIDSNELPENSEDRAKWRILHSKPMEDILIEMKDDTTQIQHEPQTSKGFNRETESDVCYTSHGVGNHRLKNQLRLKRNNETKTTITQTRKATTKTKFVGSLTKSRPLKSEKNYRKANSNQKLTSKNRMGQRERRRLWEVQYGTEAKHLKEEIHKAKKDKRKIIKVKKSLNKTSTAKSTGNTTTAADRRDKEEKLHPSWEASRKRKAQEALKQSFEGKRTVFDDSD